MLPLTSTNFTSGRSARSWARRRGLVVPMVPPNGKCVEGPVGLADPDVAGVGALGDGGDGELRGEFCGEIFE